VLLMLLLSTKVEYFVSSCIVKINLKAPSSHFFPIFDGIFTKFIGNEIVFYMLVKLSHHPEAMLGIPNERFNNRVLSKTKRFQSYVIKWILSTLEGFFKPDEPILTTPLSSCSALSRFLFA